MPDFIDRTGLQFGDWTVASYELRDRLPGWHCRCVCGVTRWVRTSNLVTGKSTGCGCGFRAKMRAAKVASGRIDLLRERHPREYSSWASMWNRCTNPAQSQWMDYGGRGITADPRWKAFSAFFADMGERPEGTSLDRIDNDQGYSAANCRWATRSEQVQNQRPRRPHKRGPYRK